MRLSVVIPSENFKASAGARIRYQRIAPELEQLGIKLKLEDLTKWTVSTCDCDAMLVSKCYDARSLVLAAEASARGKLVGVDLFDDYFSDTSDIRLLRYREWLTQFVQMANFALCSTEPLADVARQYRSDMPVHRLNDPVSETRVGTLADRLAAKLRYAKDRRQISVLWFGVGDNPYFEVGLADLAAHASRLRQLARGGVDVELTVLTNRRALSANGLELISQVPVRTSVLEWSKEAENDVLDRAFAAFLPVSAQPFSRAKSLNRALTALSAGCQILSTGYPLYAALDPLIYRDASELLGDFNSGAMRLSSETVARYEQLVADLGSPKREAQALAVFLHRLETPNPSAPRPVSVIHGEATRPGAHTLVQALGGLSVASPFCTAPLDFDVLFRGAAPALGMFVSRRAIGRLLPHARSRLQAEGIKGDLYYYLPRGPAQGHRKVPQTDSWTAELGGFQLAAYAGAIEEIQSRLTEAFGETRTIVSETSKMAYQAVTPVV